MMPGSRNGAQRQAHVADGAEQGDHEGDGADTSGRGETDLLVEHVVDADQRVRLAPRADEPGDDLVDGLDERIPQVAARREPERGDREPEQYRGEDGEQHAIGDRGGEQTASMIGEEEEGARQTQSQQALHNGVDGTHNPHHVRYVT
jgi:hypothetical protein